MTIGRIDINEKDQSKICGAIIQLEERADTAITGVVRTDIAQSLTATEQAQARSNIYAAPFDALAYNGMQINGSMEVSQQSGTTLISGVNGYALDGWLINAIGSMVLAAQQVADAPAGFTSSLKVTVTTAEASLGAGSIANIVQAIEGYRVSKLAFGTASAQSVSIGFWTKIHRTGTYSGSLRNASTNRSYPFTFIQSVADTWEFKTITIGGDTTGTWGTSNGVGIYLSFCIAAGATPLGTANAWAAVNYTGATGTVNGVAATSDTFQITGVIVLPGVELPSAARSPFIMRPYDQELVMCKRYFQSSYNQGVVPGTAWTVGTDHYKLSHPLNNFSTTFAIFTMRSDPTVTVYDANGTSGVVSWFDGAWNGAGAATVTAKQTFIGVLSTVAGAFFTNFAWKADARL